jgi:hypothetical protein
MNDLLSGMTLASGLEERDPTVFYAVRFCCCLLSLVEYPYIALLLTKGSVWVVM